MGPLPPGPLITSHELILARGVAPGGRTSTNPSGATASAPAPALLDSQGGYRARGKISWGVVGAYIFILIVVFLLFRTSGGSSYWWVPWFLGLVIVVLLVRYLSTTYRIDDTDLRAWRIFGNRRIPLEEVRSIEYTALRDLAPVGMFQGGWGWRGRMWSPRIGTFDSVYTDASLGLLVTAGSVPLFISPKNPQAFARELSRRVRSYTGRLAVDVGDPMSGTPVTRS